jgi:hypothetical protein
MRLNILILFLILSCKTSEKKQPETQKAAFQIVTAEGIYPSKKIILKKYH